MSKPDFACGNVLYLDFSFQNKVGICFTQKVKVILKAFLIYKEYNFDHVRLDKAYNFM